MPGTLSAGAPPARGLPIPASALAIGAHPDDVELECGATLARWADAGARIALCVLTDGSKGTWDPAADPAELARTRDHEQRAAAAALGAVELYQLGFVDGELAHGRAEVRAVCEVIRRARSEVLLAHDPWKRYRLHPDHRNAGFVVTDAVVAARDPGFFPDLGAPHRPDRLLLFEPDEADHVEDAGPGLDAKVRALLLHESQWRTTMGIDREVPDVAAQQEAFAQRVRARAAAVGASIGAPAGVTLGEAYKLVEPL